MAVPEAAGVEPRGSFKVDHDLALGVYHQLADHPIPQHAIDDPCVTQEIEGVTGPTWVIVMPEQKDRILESSTHVADAGCALVEAGAQIELKVDGTMKIIVIHYEDLNNNGEKAGADMRALRSSWPEAQRVIVFSVVKPKHLTADWKVSSLDLRSGAEGRLTEELRKRLGPFCVLAGPAAHLSGDDPVRARGIAMWALGRELAGSGSLEDSLKLLAAGHARAYGSAGGVAELPVELMKLFVNATISRLCSQEVHLRWGVELGRLYVIKRARTFGGTLGKGVESVVTRFMCRVKALQGADASSQSAKFGAVKSSVKDMAPLAKEMRGAAEIVASLSEAEAWASLTDFLRGHFQVTPHAVPCVNLLAQRVRDCGAGGAGDGRRQIEADRNRLLVDLCRTKAWEFLFENGWFSETARTLLEKMSLLGKTAELEASAAAHEDTARALGTLQTHSTFVLTETAVPDRKCLELLSSLEAPSQVVLTALKVSASAAEAVGRAGLPAGDGVRQQLTRLLTQFLTVESVAGSTVLYVLDPTAFPRGLNVSGVIASTAGRDEQWKSSLRSAALLESLCPRKA
jgi:hypothetical protein